MRKINNKGVYNEQQNNAPGSIVNNAGRDISSSIGNNRMGEKNSSNSWIGPLLTLLGVLITAFLTYKGIIAQTEIPIQATQTAESRLTAAASSAIPVFVGYDFESGTQGWAAAEAGFKIAKVGPTAQIVYAGNYALEIDTELFGNGSATYAARGSHDYDSHTEIAVFMKNNSPVGYNQPGPYDLTGKVLSCFVYVPNGLVVEGPHVYVRLLTKDTAFKNQFSPAVDITTDTANRWFELLITAGNGSNEDKGFDSKQINALGVRLDSLDGSVVEYTGPIYVDSCSIK